MRHPEQLIKQLFLFVACAFSTSLFSQSVTGIWRGYFISSTGENYKLEFQVKQGSQYAVSGVSYSYLDVRFYGKATMTGNFVKKSGNFLIREIKTVEVRNPMGGGTCIMNYNLQYSRSGKEEFLEGTYLGKSETPGTTNNYEWGSCGQGKVFLRKVSTSNFYVEPFLRNNVIPKSNIKPKTDSVASPPPIVRTPRVNVPPSKKDEVSPPVVKKTAPPKELVKDSTPVRLNEGVKPPSITQKKVTVLPDVLTKRQNELAKSLVIHNPDVTVKIYDNGEIDDDSISVYLDKRLVLSHKKLTATPLTVKLKMDDENPEHEMVMVAENLGRIPPNTSLMIVEAGEQRFEIRITSTEQKNAVIRFRYEASK
jgi:hypothetical protein